MSITGAKLLRTLTLQIKKQYDNQWQKNKKEKLNKKEQEKLKRQKEQKTKLQTYLALKNAKLMRKNIRFKLPKGFVLFGNFYKIR